MENYEIIRYALMVVGGIVASISAFKIYKKGILIWLILVVIGITVINFGINYQPALSMVDYFENLKPENLTSFSKERLRDVCVEFMN
ncbi:MAG: hypothetical protein OEY59_10675 [Deltaproteobacteria bacterium]|nr:hypothetical protein [Deltaproteobacteria bacterium]